MMGSVGGTGREIDEERLVRRKAEGVAAHLHLCMMQHCMMQHCMVV